MLKDLLSISIANFFVGVAKSVIGTVLLFIISWQLALVFYSAIPIVLAIAYFYGKFIQKFMIVFTDASAGKFMVTFICVTYNY